jgi:N-acetyltransferase 10
VATESYADLGLCIVCSFVLSLGDCNSCLVLDDELNVLPLSKAARGLTALPGTFTIMCPS